MAADKPFLLLTCLLLPKLGSGQRKPNAPCTDDLEFESSHNARQGGLIHTVTPSPRTSTRPTGPPSGERLDAGWSGFRRNGSTSRPGPSLHACRSSLSTPT